MTTRHLSRAGRLLLLHRLREAGALESQTLQSIGDALEVTRSTICRDFQVIDQVEEEYRRLLDARPWPDPAADLRAAGWLPLLELAEVTGYTRDHLALLVRQNKIKARKAGGRWYADPQAVEDYAATAQPGPGGPRGPHTAPLAQRILDALSGNRAANVFELSALLDEDPADVANALDQLQSTGKIQRTNHWPPPRQWPSE